MVAEVVPDGPAAKAGFEQGDIVTAIDGKSVEDSRDLTRRVAASRPARRRPSPSSRQGKPMQMKVTIGTPDEKVQLASNDGAAQDGMPAPSGERDGPGPVVADAGSARRLITSTTCHRRGRHQGRSRQRRRRQGHAARRRGDQVGNRMVHNAAGCPGRRCRSAEGRPQERAAAGGAQQGGTGFVAVDIGQDMIVSGGAGDRLRRPAPALAAAPPPSCRCRRGPYLTSLIGRRFGMRILVVEDDLEAQRYLVQGLKESGHVVDDAADGEIGLTLALSRPYDVAIIDRMLPKMDGLGVVAEMREHGNTTPVLFLSALSEVDDRVKGLKAGGDDYLTKPYAFVELLARIDALMRRRIAGRR